MKRILLVVAVIVLYFLHQDFWFWRTARLTIASLGIDWMPFGFVPIGLFYQGCFSVAASLLMWMLVKFAWPEHLEREIEQTEAEIEQGEGRPR